MTHSSLSSTVATAAASTPTAFKALGLTQPLIQALSDAGYTQPTPIQTQAIPPLLKGRDLLGLAETGTGKTAAFSLPLLQMLATENRRPAPKTCRALILAPTRELAIQIGESIEVYGKHLSLTHTLVFGGVGHRPQINAMARGVDVLIATTGRLLDLLEGGQARLDGVSHLVLDEADRMLDMGFIHDVRKIARMLPKSRQSLLFSATMPDDIASLAASLLKDPVRVEVTRTGKTVDRIRQEVYFVTGGQKKAALAALLQDPAFARVIVFTRTKRGADRVARTLASAKIPAHVIHGNKSQNARQDALEAFRSGHARVLVATDIAARGIDVEGITHVINYELPNIPESYVHRIGRTARAGAEGVAIALCAPDERPYLRDIERLTRTPLTNVGEVKGIEAFADLKDAPLRGDDRDDNHFSRGKRQIDSGRRNNRPYESRSAAGPGDRPAAARGDRPTAGRSDRSPAPRGAAPSDRAPRAAAPRPAGAGGDTPRFEKRPAPAASGAPKPWQNQAAARPAPARDSGARENAPRDDRRSTRPAYPGPRSDTRFATERPADRPAPRPDAAAARPAFDARDPNLSRRSDAPRPSPAGARSSADRPASERPRQDDRRDRPQGTRSDAPRTTKPHTPGAGKTWDNRGGGKPFSGKPGGARSAQTPRSSHRPGNRDGA